MNFATWWDTTKGTATPETYAGWEESCRQAWHAALENSVLESARIAELESARQVQDAALFVARADFRELAIRAEQAEAQRDALRATLKQAREALIKSRGLCSVKQASIHVAAAIAAIDKVQP